jgi:hypothetical protein
MTAKKQKARSSCCGCMAAGLGSLAALLLSAHQADLRHCGAGRGFREFDVLAVANECVCA